MRKWIQIDERASSVAGTLSFLFLGLTQAGLLLALVYQRYVLNLPQPYYNDLAVILVGSISGYWLFSLYLGGVLPILSPRSILLAYAFLVAAIGLPHTLIRGFPQAGEWPDRLLVILGAPALLVGGYALVATLGKRRLDRMAGN